jgi:hypothetical protein
MDDDSKQLEHFERMGEAAVRMDINNDCFPHSIRALAINWLAQRDEESERRREASQAEQIDIARSAKDAAWAAAMAAERAATAAEKANIRAIVALIIATISIIATVTGIWVVHRDVRNFLTPSILRWKRLCASFCFAELHFRMRLWRRIKST